jgi:hypothetical protein
LRREADIGEKENEKSGAVPRKDGRTGSGLFPALSFGKEYYILKGMISDG